MSLPSLSLESNPNLTCYHLSAVYLLPLIRLSARELSNAFWSLGKLNVDYENELSVPLKEILMAQLTRFIETMKLFDIESVFVGLGLMQVNFDYFSFLLIPLTPAHSFSYTLSFPPLLFFYIHIPPTPFHSSSHTLSFLPHLLLRPLSSFTFSYLLSFLFLSSYRDIILSYHFYSSQSSTHFLRALLSCTRLVFYLHSPRLVSSRWIFDLLMEKRRMPCFTL